MKISKPDRGLGFYTIVWLLASLFLFWAIVDMRFPLSVVPLTGIVASIGIWLNIRSAGYLFAISNIGVAIFGGLVSAGYILPDRPISWQTVLVPFVSLYYAFASFRWARDESRCRLPHAG